MEEDARTPASFVSFFLRTTADASLRLTQSTIDSFSDLIDQEVPEREYQDFLTDNPIFLDPIAAEVVPLAPLGLEFKTDFVVRKHDNSYVVVEIEKPQDRIFTNAYNFTAEFTHAFGQVLDFQSWTATHIAYARSHLPNINQPRGLLVIGRRSTLDERASTKLAQWQINSPSIEVLTYDDLLSRAQSLLGSLRSHLR